MAFPLNVFSKEEAYVKTKVARTFPHTLNSVHLTAGSPAQIGSGLISS